MANRYWVGGAGTWNSLNILNWSATSGGVGSATVPTSADTAIFDASSGGGAVLLGENVTCLAVNMTAFTGSLNYQSFKIILVRNGGNVFIGGTGYSVSGTPLIESNYAGSTGTRTFNMGATTEANSVSVNITAGSDLVAISSGSAVKNLNFTGFSGQLSNVVGRTYYGNLIYSATMTLASGTSAQTFASTSGTQQITTNARTLDFPLTFNGVSGNFAFQDALTQGSTRAFTITNGTVQLKSGVTSTVGSLTTSSTNQKFLQSTLAGTQATLSQATGIVSVGYLTIKDINASGGATFNAYTVNSNVNAGNNLGWDFFAQLGKTIFTRRKEKRVLI